MNLDSSSASKYKKKLQPNNKWKHFLAVLGPGLVVMLADTDAGSVITAAQSGAQWGYKLLGAQLILIPILYVVQELTVRLGLVTKKGHGELIRETFGMSWAILSVVTLIVACVGALLTEFSGLSGVGSLFGIPSWLTMIFAAGGLILVVVTGSYRSVERVAIFVGLFELVFLIVPFYAKPNALELWSGILHPALNKPSYIYLLIANIGAVIMPWMVFYQQSAIVDKNLDEDDLKPARWDTAIGSVITQLVMAGILVITAATIGKSNPNTPLNDVPQIANALTPFLGQINGKLFFAMGMIGASLVAAIVVSLTAAWGVGEVFGFKHSLEHHPKEAPWFYTIFIASVVFSAIFVGSNVNLVAISVGVQVMNAALLPIVLFFLYALARKALPPDYKLKGIHSVLFLILTIALSCLNLFGAYQTAFPSAGN